MKLETRKILVTVKAYPNPSRKYQETVCVAGIDLDSKSWIRLYPIPFRDLEDNKKFKKYDVISIKVFKSPDDHRPESYKVDRDSIEIIDSCDTKRNWEKRKEIVLPSLSKSYCDILKESELNRKSLGIFKPEKVVFDYNKVKQTDLKEVDKYYKQQAIFDKEKTPIEPIPYDFRYHFFCKNEENCAGHDLLIIDWEINQSFRRWRYKYKSESLLLDKIKERWLNGMCSDKHDTYFFVGNMMRFRKTFMVLGVFYPQKISS